MFRSSIGYYQLLVCLVLVGCTSRKLAESPIPGTVSSNEVASARQPLSPEDITSLVGEHRAHLREKCWEPYVQTSDIQSGEVVSFQATLKILRLGAVVGVDIASKRPPPPMLAGCIKETVVGWRFRASSSGTKVNIPFVFSVERSVSTGGKK